MIRMHTAYNTLVHSVASWTSWIHHKIIQNMPLKAAYKGPVPPHQNSLSACVPLSQFKRISNPKRELTRLILPH